MNNKVITITGPTGSGKSTVSYALAKKLGHCVCIEVDHIKHMIISGFYKQDGNWQYSEWRLVGETLGIVANNFLNRDFDVVIAGYLQSEAWEELEKQVIISHKILLNPSKEVIKIRDSGRDPKYYMGEKAIQ
ncbi:MAG TPA: AAA family ATPase, partial [Candidatus Saccharibacteria bacterium]|nr:AAA family ATPase [Candidatus Saccharibacteria bacterium]